MLITSIGWLNAIKEKIDVGDCLIHCSGGAEGRTMEWI